MRTQTNDVREAIAAANKNFMTTFARNDGTGMALLYTESGQLLPTGSDVVSGHDNIDSFWQGAIDMGIKEVKLETVELERHGDTAIEVGRYTLSGTDGQMMDQGKYIVIWKQEDMQWKLHRDIWNSSMPAPKA
jgi:uncharacterized protein (TIGR02246 family)